MHSDTRPTDPDAVPAAGTHDPSTGATATQTGDHPRLEALIPGTAVLGGVLAAINGPAPTGHSFVDSVIVAGSVAAVIWFSSVIPVRVAGAFALLAGCTALTWPGLVLGVVAYLIAVRDSAVQPSPKWLSAGILAIAMNLAARSELAWFFGASSIIGVGIAVAALAAAVACRPKRDRRLLATVIATVTVASVVAGAFLANAAVSSRDDLRNGEAAVQRGLDELVAGEIDEAVASFDEAEAAFDRAHDRLSSPLTSLAVIIPVAAQHRRAGVELTSEAQRAAETLATELRPIDLEQLSFSQGRIDVEALAALAEPLSAVRADIGDLGSTVAGLDNPWLVEPVRDRLSRLEDDIAEQLDRSELFVDVVDHVPAMLGRDGVRRYFIAFTTPSEARGLGGFLGNWAELEMDDGRIEMTRFGRSDDLDEGVVPGERTITGPTDWLARYGQFGFDNGPGGGVNVQPWKNITMSASMKSTGQVIAELYPQSGGHDVDGVIAMDVFAVSALLELTGPIELPDDEGTITAESAPRFLLKDQYDADDNAERIDVLEIVSNQALATLLESDLPPPKDILDLLGPLVERGSIVGYAQAPEEQALLERSGLGGTLVDPVGRDGLAISYNNSIGNKIDFYLHSSADYRVVADQRTGATTATLELNFENRSPRAGQPNYVIGNAVDEPPGTNRSIVSIYSQLPLDSASLNGDEVDIEQTTEAGYFVTGVVVELPAGASSTLMLSFAGALDLDDGYKLALRTPPSANNVQTSVDATLVTDSGDLVEREVFRRAGRHELDIVPPES